MDASRPAMALQALQVAQAPRPKARPERQPVPRSLAPLTLASSAVISAGWPGRNCLKAQCRSAVRRSAATVVKEVKEVKDELRGEVKRPIEGDVIAKFDHGCLVMWLLPQQALQLATWLSEWEGEAFGNQETNFWRQRMIVAMKSRLEKLAFDPGSEAGDEAPFQVYSVHNSSNSSKPLAVAMVSTRSFNLEPLTALHLDHIVNSPEPQSKGFGATLLQGLVQRAAMSKQVLVIEPQSPGLEAYFTRLGFRHIKEVDPYLWIPSGPLDQEVSLRYVLLEDADHERLLAAFKRPPEWTGVTEQFYMASRQDTSSLDVLALFTCSRATYRRGFARRMRREKPSAPYKVDVVEEVDLSEIMAIMRSPEKLEEVSWASAEGFGQGPWTSLPGNFSGVGRCSVSQKAFPLPGLHPSLGKIDFVVESLEWQMRRDPVYSVSITCTLGILAEVLEVARDFFNTFRIRAAFHHNPLAWDIEVVQSDGLALASMESPPLPGNEKKRPDDLDIF